MTIHVLVKDYGHEGLAVCGVTTQDTIAQAWESGDDRNRRIECDTDASLSPTPYLLAERI